jgi:hypothetical protein
MNARRGVIVRRQDYRICGINRIDLVDLENPVILS